jgi:glutaconate CoA-transferase subunit A
VEYVGYMQMEPVAFFHELLRQGRRDLRLVLAPSSGLVADLMIGAGALADIEFSSLSFMEFGFAPNFRRHAEAGTLASREHT